MSRIGKEPIKIEKGVQAELAQDVLKIKGQKGELSLKIHPDIVLELKPEEILVKVKKQEKEGLALWGLFRSLIANMVVGVTSGFEKKLEFEGVGYKAQVSGDKLILDIGFSHPVEVQAPPGISFAVEKNVISVSGIDKQLVGQIAAQIRAKRKPEPYKGTGIRYQGEIIRRKIGKKATAGTE